MRSQHFWHRSAPNRILLLLGRIPVSFTLDFFLQSPMRGCLSLQSVTPCPCSSGIHATTAGMLILLNPHTMTTLQINFRFFKRRSLPLPNQHKQSNICATLFCQMIRLLAHSVVDPDPYWIPIQELFGSGSTLVKIGKNRHKF